MIKFPSVWMKQLSLGERIANELRLQILENKISTGEILSENQIANRYGTSRSPVRDAFKALSLEGLIRLERMGAVVTGMSTNDMQELYDVREMIENFAQQHASFQNIQSLVEQLNQDIDKMEIAAKYNDHSEFAFQDLTFHETIILYSAHKRIINMWNSLRPLIMSVILVTTEDVFSFGNEHVEWVINKHRKIIQGLQTKNGQIIGDSVSNYFEDSKRTLSRTFSESEKKD